MFQQGFELNSHHAGVRHTGEKLSAIHSLSLTHARAYCSHTPMQNREHWPTWADSAITSIFWINTRHIYNIIFTLGLCPPCPHQRCCGFPIKHVLAWRFPLKELVPPVSTVGSKQLYNQTHTYSKKPSHVIVAAIIHRQSPVGKEHGQSYSVCEWVFTHERESDRGWQVA